MRRLAGLMFGAMLACNSATSIVDQPCAKEACGCLAVDCHDGTCCSKDESCDEAGGTKGCGWTGPPAPDFNGNFGTAFSWHPRTKK